MKIYSFLTLIAIAFFACNGSKQNATPETSPPLVGTYWKLTELNGQPLPPADSVSRREIYLLLRSTENRAGGNGGCNGYGGTFTGKGDGFGLSFSQMIRTQMACPGLDIENQYLAVLEKTDSYYITGNELQLNRARMAPLAKFVAVPGKADSMQ